MIKQLPLLLGISADDFGEVAVDVNYFNVANAESGEKIFICWTNIYAAQYFNFVCLEFKFDHFSHKEIHHNRVQKIISCNQNKRQSHQQLQSGVKNLVWMMPASARRTSYIFHDQCARNPRSIWFCWRLVRQPAA